MIKNFTNGEWKAEKKSESQTCHLIKTGDKYTIHVYDSKYGISEIESWENARLIAIAPLMYNLLNQLKARLNHFNDIASIAKIDILLSGNSEISNNH